MSPPPPTPPLVLFLSSLKLPSSTCFCKCVFCNSGMLILHDQFFCLHAFLFSQQTPRSPVPSSMQEGCKIEVRFCKLQIRVWGLRMLNSVSFFGLFCGWRLCWSRIDFIGWLQFFCFGHPRQRDARLIDVRFCKLQIRVWGLQYFYFFGGGLFVAGGYVDWDWFHRLIVILLYWASNTETSKKAALEAAAVVSDLLVESINGGVQEVFVNEKQIEMEARSMGVTVQRFSKQTSQWLNVIHTFDSALKVSSTQFLLLPFVFLFLLSLSLFLSPLVCVLSAAK